MEESLKVKPYSWLNIHPPGLESKAST